MRAWKFTLLFTMQYNTYRACVISIRMSRSFFNVSTFWYFSISMHHVMITYIAPAPFVNVPISNSIYIIVIIPIRIRAMDKHFSHFSSRFLEDTHRLIRFRSIFLWIYRRAIRAFFIVIIINIIWYFARVCTF